MKRIFLATSIAFVLVFFAVLIINNITEAQRTERPDRPERGAQRERPRGQFTAQRALENLFGGIRTSFWQVAMVMDTNDEQLVKIRADYKEVLKDVVAKGNELRKKERELRQKARDLQPEERRQQMSQFSQQTRELISGVNSNLKDKLKTTLTEGQFAKYEGWEKKRQERARRSLQNRRERPRRDAGRSEPSKPAEKGE